MDTLTANIWKLRLIRVSVSFIFFTPIIVLFWQNHGLSMSEIMLLQSCYAFGAAFFEIPTGYFADRLTRKISIILGVFFLASGFALYAFMETFFGFLIAELILSLGMAFLSGAESAFLYETLLSLGREEEHTKIYGKNDFYAFCTLAGASIVGSFVAPFIGYAGVIFLSVPCIAIGLITALSLHEPPKQYNSHTHHTSAIESLTLLMKEHFHFSSSLFRIILLSGMIYALGQAVLWIYQPYFSLIGVPIPYFGVIFASFQIVAGIASNSAHVIEKGVGRKNIFLFLLSLLLGSYILMGAFPFLFAFMFCALQQAVRGFLKPIVTTEINRIAPSQYRATLLSAKGLMDRIMYALLIPGIGVIIDRYGLLCGIWTLAIGAGTLLGFLLIQRGGKGLH